MNVACSWKDSFVTPNDGIFLLNLMVGGVSPSYLSLTEFSLKLLGFLEVLKGENSWRCCFVFRIEAKKCQDF